MPVLVSSGGPVCVCVCVRELHQLVASSLVGVERYSGVPQGTALNPVGSRPIATSPPTIALISPFDWLGYSAAEVNRERCVN